MRLKTRHALLCLACAFSVMTGCASYRTPSGGADFTALADTDIQQILERKPASKFPVHMAVGRIQDADYQSHTSCGSGRGRFSIVTTRDVETDEDFQRLVDLPELVNIVPLNRLLLRGDLTCDRPLRQAAASLHADMLLLYTFDTQFFETDAMRPLSVITLGLSPNQLVRVTTTASAMLLDVRTGYVYGACEATAQRKQLASAWTSNDAIDQSRLKTEREAFVDLLGEFETLWQQILDNRPANASVGVGAGDS